MRMSIKELVSVAEERLADRHLRQKADFEGIEIEVLEEILRLPSIDPGLRVDLSDWLVQAKRHVKIEVDHRELHANSWERLSLPLAVLFFGTLSWLAQTLLVSGQGRIISQIVAFGVCGMLWWIVRSEALRIVTNAKKRQVLLGKVE